MPAGSFTLDPWPVPLARPPQVFLVFRYVKGNTPGTFSYQLLPNIRCEAIHFREGAEPGSADLRYVFDPIGVVTDPFAPAHIEQVYPLAAAGPYTVHHDDRLVVGRLRADGSLQLIFDGYAQIPQANLSGKAEEVSFQAIGTPLREWDTPIGGAVYRNADAPATVKDVDTALPTRFNADLKSNATDDGQDSGLDPTKYPVFLDERICKARSIGRKWTLGMAVRYLIMQGNPGGEFIDYPAFVSAGVPVLENALSAIVPFVTEQGIDWTNPGSYNLEPVLAPDYDATGKAWPEAIEDLITPHGFGMAFRLAAKNGEPYWTLEIYRKDNPYRIKVLTLQPYGSTMLDPGRSNVGTVRLQRDVSHLANEWVADTQPMRYEASFVLAPGFIPQVGDAVHDVTSATLKPFLIGTDHTLAQPVRYRDYIFDETADGHWDLTTTTFVTDKATSLDDVLGKGNYAFRRRPGLGTLISVDDKGKPLKMELWVSRDYAGPVPGVWDGKSGTWQQATKGEWELLKDRLGIKITAQNPQDWNIGGKFNDSKPFPSGKVCLIDEATKGIPPGALPLIFRLTCVIEGDLDIGAVASKRQVSPTSFTITRRDDCRDRFKKETVSVRSHFNATGKNQVKRDDTDKAKAHVEARRRVNETARFGGSVTIPRFTAGYRIGDRLKLIRGRNIDLRTNLGADQGESPEYPAVVGIDWHIGNNLSTVLHLSDRRIEGSSAARTV